ncbi:MAG: hypothetical protein JSW27_03530 [Phycisphaerales bacterium]|nr:MAG: hypothetical protein JSW27_03530 [Phycisphaerales bacterium]
MKCWRCILIVLIAADAGLAAESVHRTDHVVVTYEGIEQPYAEAMARVAEAARDIAVQQFGFNMPEVIKINATLNTKQPVRLFTDGHDSLTLNVKTAENLRKPSDSGIFNIYGICHEVGHVAMYRLIHDRLWMTPAAAEGWAHYLGSRIVDEVYAREKEDLWPDKYDYLADGMARLNEQLARPKPSDTAKAAGLWKELVQIVGDDGIAAVFTAWSKADVDATDPGAALRAALLATNSDSRLAQWWNEAEPLLVFKRPRSGFVARTAKAAELFGQPLELAHDDGRQTSKSSIAGSGHAVRFETLGDNWYLTAVRLYGSRYGHRAPPREDFQVWLCDKDFKVIADFAMPYSRFRRGGPRWVNLPVEPTNVPSEFIICVGFNPTRTKGVYVGYDGSPSGNSFVGLAGKEGRAFQKGDWMIRVKLDQLKTADALRPVE